MIDMALTDPLPATCPHMDLLIELLAGFPSGQGKRAVQEMVERLDLLAYDARWQGARDETLAAIQGARILVDIAELPPLRGLSLLSPHERRRAVGLRSD